VRAARTSKAPTEPGLQLPLEVRPVAWAAGRETYDARFRRSDQLELRRAGRTSFIGELTETNLIVGNVKAFIALHIGSSTNMNRTQRWLAVVRPRHNPAENALIHNMRGDPNIPWLNSLAAMQHYARQRWPHDPAVQSLIPGLWQRYRRWEGRHCPKDTWLISA
jgi:hypothetical protein